MDWLVVDKIETAKNIFENGEQFIQSYQEKRAGGGHHIYRGFVLNNIEVSIPLIFGSATYYEDTITKIHCQSEYYSNCKYPHIKINGGKYKKIHFNKFCSPLKKNENERLPDLKIEITGGDFFEELIFSNSKIGSIKITGGIFYSKIHFERGIYDQVEISGGEFKQGISFGEIIPPNSAFEYTGGFQVKDSLPWTSIYNGIYKNIIFNGDFLSKNIKISNCFVYNKILINSKLTEFEFTNLLIQEKVLIWEGIISIKSSLIETLKFNENKSTSKIIVGVLDSNCNNLIFEGYSSKESLISFKQQKSNLCKFINFINYGSISFNGLELDDSKLDLANAITDADAQSLNPGDYRLSLMNSHLSGDQYLKEIIKSYEAATKPNSNINRVDTKSSIHLLNSDIGKTSFFASKIDNSNLYFKDSKLTDIFLAGTRFPDNQNYQNGFDPIQQRFALSQIKKIYENRGDSLAASEYSFKELEVHRDELNNEKSSKNRGERISLFLNYWSNRHGQNWIRPLWLILAIGSTFWLVICLILFDINFRKLNTNSFLISLKSAIYFVQYLLPIHKLDLLSDFAFEVAGIKKNSLNGRWIIPILNFLDLIWRIISGLLTYQLIIAFRRHGKK